MTDYGIIFSAPMVKALLDGRKVMTRRMTWRPNGKPTLWQKVRPGDRLWVRESWSSEVSWDDTKPSEIASDACNILYVADDHWSDHDPMNAAGKIRPSMFMPRWASRLTLTVEATKIEPVQQISEADAVAEGIYPVFATQETKGESVPWFAASDADGFDPHLTARAAFRQLWKSLHGEDSWRANPEVVAMTGTVEQRNIDREAP